MLEASFHSRDDRAWDLGSLGVTRARHRPGQRTGRHAHERATLHFVLSGLYVEHGGDGSVVACPGDLLLKRPGVEHWNAFGTTTATTLRIEVDEGTLESLVSGRPGVALVRAPAPWALCEAFLDMAEALEQPGQAPGPAAQRLRRSLEASLTALDATPPPRRDDGPPRPPEGGALDALRQDPPTSASISALALELGVHRCHLARRFRARFGCSPSQYAQARRVARLAERLARGETGLARLAGTLGFADQSHGTRAFKRWLGLPPAAWLRERQRAAGACRG